MLDLLYPLLRAAHVVGGLAAFGLGTLATLLPKSGAGSRWHRLAGQGYALSMLLMGLTSLPLSLRTGSGALLVSGPLTLLGVVWGWLSLRRARQARQRGEGARADRLLRWHVILMGISYIAAWTAFLQNQEPFGSSLVAYWASIIVPGVVGSLLIARAVQRFTAEALR